MMHELHPYFRDDHPVILDEETYKDIMAAINPHDLPHRDYAPLIKYVKYQGYKNDTMAFFVPNKYNGWTSYIQWVEWDEHVRDKSLTAPEAARLLLYSSPIRFHCGCPSYRYWGYQYIDTQLDMAIYPEDRYPSIRNPNLMGLLCKHGRRTMKVLPFHLADMASAIKEQRNNIGA